MRIADAMLGLQREFAGNGVRAALDPSQVQPPCILIAPASAERDTLCDQWTVTLDVWAVAPPSRLGDSYPTLGGLIAAVSTLLEPDSCDFQSFQFGDTYLPAAVLRAQITLED